MARTRHPALVTATVVLALSAAACTSSKEPVAITGGTSTSSTTTTVVGAGPAVRVAANDPASLGRLFAAWAIPLGADGYVGACAPDPAIDDPGRHVVLGGDHRAPQAARCSGCSTRATPRRAAAVLIAPVDGFYRIDDSFTFGDGTPPAWVGGS